MLELSTEATSVAGILMLAVVTIEFGGWVLTRMATGAVPAAIASTATMPKYMIRKKTRAQRNDWTPRSMLGLRRCIGRHPRRSAGGRAPAAGKKNSPSRWRFRPPNSLTFRFRVRPPG